MFPRGLPMNTTPPPPPPQKKNKKKKLSIFSILFNNGTWQWSGGNTKINGLTSHFGMISINFWDSPEKAKIHSEIVVKNFLQANCKSIFWYFCFVGQSRCGFAIGLRNYHLIIGLGWLRPRSGVDLTQPKDWVKVLVRAVLVRAVLVSPVFVSCCHGDAAILNNKHFHLRSLKWRHSLTTTPICLIFNRNLHTIGIHISQKFDKDWWSSKGMASL